MLAASGTAEAVPCQSNTVALDFSLPCPFKEQPADSKKIAGHL
jgi:hypothetical protein